MGRSLSYYDVLGINRYRRLSLKYHPDTDPSPEAAAEFARIGEAYDVLSDAKHKGAYDLFGEEGLKAATAEGPGYRYDSETGPRAVFARFFGTSNPYEALQALSKQFESLTTEKKPQPGRQQQYDLVLSLEEIFAGCSRVVSHTRRALSSEGLEVQELRTLTVEVSPGMVDGTKFVFQGEGDVTGKQAAGPVAFVLKGAPHPRFSRRGADLLHNVKLPLWQALVGGAVPVLTLDNRTLSVPLECIITPGASIRVPGEGMPLPGGAKGDLIVSFELLFPAHLTEGQKLLLRAACHLPGKLDEVQAKALRAFEAAFKDESHGWSAGFAKGGR